MMLGTANMTLHPPPKIIIFGAPRSAIHPQLKTAAGSAQLLGVVLVMILMHALAEMAIPAILGIFFVPALSAACVQFARARRVAVAQATPAFELIAPRPVVPIPADAGNAIAETSVPGG